MSYSRQSHFFKIRPSPFRRCRHGVPSFTKRFEEVLVQEYAVNVQGSEILTAISQGSGKPMSAGCFKAWGTIAWCPDGHLAKKRCQSG